MNKKTLLKYILIYVPMLVGIILFSSGTINILSSILLFAGGYVALKNTFDYRKIKKNINSLKKINIIHENTDSKKETITPKNKKEIKPKRSENIIGLKNTRRYIKIRRRY